MQRMLHLMFNRPMSNGSSVKLEPHFDTSTDAEGGLEAVRAQLLVCLRGFAVPKRELDGPLGEL